MIHHKDKVHSYVCNKVLPTMKIIFMSKNEMAIVFFKGGKIFQTILSSLQPSRNDQKKFSKFQLGNNSTTNFLVILKD